MASNPKLYELGADLEETIAEIVENEGLLTDELEARLNALDLAFDEKVERVVMAIRAEQARAEMVRNEIRRLAELAAPHDQAADSLKAYLFTQMQRVGKRKVDMPLAKAWIQKNSRPSIRYAGADPDNLTDLPEELVRTVKHFDGRAAYEAWKAGEQLPENVHVEEGQHLRVK